MKKIEVVAAIVQDGEKIFATQRGYGEFKDGWEFPGGKIEPGESKETALARELKEELDMSSEKKKNKTIEEIPDEESEEEKENKGKKKKSTGIRTQKNNNKVKDNKENVNEDKNKGKNKE